LKRKGELYFATLHVNGKPHRASDPNIFTAAHTAYYYAVPDYPGLEFPLLDLIGAYAAENGLQGLCSICHHLKNMPDKCSECVLKDAEIFFCHWGRS
jgi:hypothetical protein